jgi:hypothetical protein
LCFSFTPSVRSDDGTVNNFPQLWVAIPSIQVLPVEDGPETLLLFVGADLRESAGGAQQAGR